MTIYTAIELNNIAADVMECGAVGDARNICRASILHLRTTEVSSAAPGFRRGEDTVHADILQARMDLEESRRMCTSMSSNEQMQVVTNPPSSSFQPTNPQHLNTIAAPPILDDETLRLLYNRPIRIHFDENGDDAPSNILLATTIIDKVEQISGVVLYNFALSHQKLAIRDQDIVHMHKASALYDMALKLLMSDVARQTRALNDAEDADDESTPANHRQDSTMEDLTLLSAAACLHNSAQISLLLNGKNADVVNLLDAVHKLCNLQSKRISRRDDDPDNIDVDAEEAWNLFFFSALNLPLSGISRAA